jgi:hypothetical protein
MLKLLERNIASIENRLVLLAPHDSPIGSYFEDVHTNSAERRRLLAMVQRLRGSIYLDDGAIGRSDLSEDGRHQTPEDDKSWHLLMLDRQRRVSACVWYMEHPSDAAFSQMRARHTPLAVHPQWGSILEDAVHGELAEARRKKLRYAEVGGWAVSSACRCRSEGLLLALAAYSLGRIGSGTLGMTTATVRHSSSTILRRLGGSPLEARGTAVPPYFDARYDCQMELLRFDSRRPSRKYAGLIDSLKNKLAQVSVIASDTWGRVAGTDKTALGETGTQVAAA